MQCSCSKIIITRRVVESIADPVMREICYLLMAGLNLNDARAKLKLPLMAFEMFIDELKRRLINAGLELRGA